MTLVATQGLWMPHLPQFNLAPTFTSSVIDAAGEKIAWVGPFWNKDRATKSITKVGFLPGAITVTGTPSNMRISLQNVDAATGQPMRPDGTQDQTVDFLASAPTGSTWYQTAALNTTRSVAHNEMLAVVLEFETFVATEAFNVQNLGGILAGLFGISGVSLFTASWAQVNVIPNIILEADDGTFGTLLGSWPAASTVLHNAVTTASTPDEIALQFSVPFACKLDGAWLMVGIQAAGRNFDVVLYQGTTALATLSVDAEYVGAVSVKLVIAPLTEVTLVPGTTYYLAFKPTTAANTSGYSFTVANANHFQAHAGGTSWQYASRTDAGAWTSVATQRMYGGISISALHDGGGGHIASRQRLGM